VRRRITAAIVGVTAFILVAVGIPLAIVAQRSVVRSEVVKLQASAAQTLTEIARPIDTAQLAALRGEPDAPPPFAVYDTTGSVVFGDGPVPGDAAVDGAMAGSTTTTTAGAVVVATPITDPDENMLGVLRIATSLTAVNGRVREVWLIMAAVGVLAIGTSWLLADRLGRRLASPLVDLADTARQTSVGGVIEQSAPTGIAEIDELHEALVDNSVRISDALVRERQFSADVSHQLRTPIAALRLKLEAAHDHGHLDESALADLTRLEATVDHLLALARDAQPISAGCVLDEVIAHTVSRWSAQIGARHRALTTSGSAGRVDAAATAIGQVLDVLIDNALRHGQGDIGLVVRSVAGGVALDVHDEGSLAPSLSERDLFARHEGLNHGIGLALARSVTQAEGGRLVLAHRDPTTFSVVLLSGDRDDRPGTTAPGR
jgi:signal transduction histidine kinase